MNGWVRQTALDFDRVTTQSQPSQAVSAVSPDVSAVSGKRSSE